MVAEIIPVFNCFQFEKYTERIQSIIVAIRDKFTQQKNLFPQLFLVLHFLIFCIKLHISVEKYFSVSDT